MTIEKGGVWGRPDAPKPQQIVEHDRALAATVHGSLVGDEDRATLGVMRGDVLASLGLERPRESEAMAYDMDIVTAELDETETVPFVAHLLVPPGFRRPCVAAMNTPLWRRYRLGPRAHPNDGLVDVTSGRLPLRQFPEALRRARTGTHLPHPDLVSERRQEWTVSFARPAPLFVDGTFVGRAKHLRLTVIPDAFTLIA